MRYTFDMVLDGTMNTPSFIKVGSEMQVILRPLPRVFERS
jgi:hypothetical protein